MRLNVVCDYCNGSNGRDLFILTLTNLKNREDSCTKIICDKCFSHLSTTLDAILDKRDINDALKDIENNLFEN